jgi:hypothetical protein
LFSDHSLVEVLIREGGMYHCTRVLIFM